MIEKIIAFFIGMGFCVITLLWVDILIPAAKKLPRRYHSLAEFIFDTMIAFLFTLGFISIIYLIIYYVTTKI